VYKHDFFRISFRLERFPVLNYSPSAERIEIFWDEVIHKLCEGKNGLTSRRKTKWIHRDPLRKYSTLACLRLRILSLTQDALDRRKSIFSTILVSSRLAWNEKKTDQRRIFISQQMIRNRYVLRYAFFLLLLSITDHGEKVHSIYGFTILENWIAFFKITSSYLKVCETFL